MTVKVTPSPTLAHKRATSYRYLGLTVSCERPLPRLRAGGSQLADVSLLVRDEHRAALPALDWQLVEGWTAIWRATNPAGTWLRVRYSVTAPSRSELAAAWAEFIISPDGRHVWCTLQDPKWWPDAVELFTGALFSAIISRRGGTCLHANVVEFNGRCIGIIGNSGAGKSTMSLALVRRGAHLVCDDIAALCGAGTSLGVWPGVPRLRTLEPSATLAPSSFDELEPLWSVDVPHEDKRYVDLSASTPDWPDEPLPLAALYFLADSPGDDPSVERLGPAEAVRELMAYRQMPELLDPGSVGRDFLVVADLVAEVPVGMLRRPRRLEALDAAAALILDDAGCAA